MAKDFLAIPGTSVMSEASFSEGRYLLLYNRSRTQWPTVRAILCLRSWLRLNVSKAKTGSDSDCSEDDDVVNEMAE